MADSATTDIVNRSKSYILKRKSTALYKYIQLALYLALILFLVWIVPCPSLNQHNRTVSDVSDNYVGLKMLSH